MSERVAQKLQMASFEDLFGSSEPKEELSSIKKRGTVILVPVDRLFPFCRRNPDDPDQLDMHPFKVVDDEEMETLVESIRENGVYTPLIVRENPDRNEGGFQIISGHRRAHAARAAMIKAVPVIVKDLDDDEATIAMVDANMQREYISPVEKGKAFRMKAEALKHQGKRTDLTSVQFAPKLTTGKIGEAEGMSSDTVKRYIRLTELDPFFQDLVDQNRLGVSTGATLSYVAPEDQEKLHSYFGEGNVVISGKQAEALKAASRENDFTEERLKKIFVSEKPRNFTFSFTQDIYDKYFSRNSSKEDVQKVIFAALDEWFENHRKQKEG